MDSKSFNVARRFIDQASTFIGTDYLPKIERCLEQLSDEEIWFRANAASNSIGNLVLHLCGNARQWIIAGLGGNADRRDRDSEFNQREVIPRAELLSRLRATVAEVEQVLATLDPSVLLEQRSIQGKDVEVLEALFHATEHFSMHTGQIILLTKTMVNADLRFYDFSSGVPVGRWRENR